MERRKTMGFKNDSVYRTRRILCLVIFVLLLSIIVVCISIACRGTCANHGDSHGPVSAKPSAPQPAVTDTPALQTEPAQTDNLRQLKQQKPRLLPTESRLLLRKAT